MEGWFSALVLKLAANMPAWIKQREQKITEQNRESNVSGYCNIPGVCWFGLEFWPRVSLLDKIHIQPRVQQSWDSTQKDKAIKIFEENVSKYKRSLDKRAGLYAREMKTHKHPSSYGIRLQSFDWRYSPQPGEDGAQFIAVLDSRGMLSVIVGLPWNSGKLTAEKVCAAFYLCLNLFDQFTEGCYPRKSRSVQVFAHMAQFPGDFGTSWDGQELPDVVFAMGSEWCNHYKPIETIKFANINPEASAKKYTEEFLRWLGSMYHEDGLKKLDIKGWLSCADACDANTPENQLLQDKTARIYSESALDRAVKQFAQREAGGDDEQP